MPSSRAIAIAIAIATTAAASPAAPPDTATPPGTLVDHAVERIERGDYEGARILLDEASLRPGADVDAVTYLTAVTWELEGDPARAIALYDLGLGEWPTSPLTDDRVFRKAESLATLGEPRAALRLLGALDDAALAPEDRAKLQLVRGIAYLSDGRRRRGRRIVARTLADLDPDVVPFYQAKARVTWARSLADEAANLRLQGREKRVVKRLERRAILLREIEAQVTAAARLDEPEWVLDGLLTLGHAYADVGRDMLAAPIPASLTEDQAAAYADLIRERAVVVLTKASRHFGAGVDLAARIGWQSRRVGELIDAKAALDAEIEALDAPDRGTSGT